MTRGSDVRVRVFSDIEELSRAAAEYVVFLAQQNSGLHRFTIALSGGSTPKRLYTLLGSSPYRDLLPWQQMHFFWADERCVPKDHQESNFKLAADTFLSEVAVPKENIHRIKGEEGPERAAREYEQDMRSFFGPAPFPVFDLIILGAGEDGHTASLFPGSFSLRAGTRLALPVYLEPPKLNRATLTLPVLNNAAHILFLVSGRAKADVVSAVLEGNNVQSYPAGFVRPLHGEVTWFIDREAGEKFKGQSHT